MTRTGQSYRQRRELGVLLSPGARGVEQRAIARLREAVAVSIDPHVMVSQLDLRVVLHMVSPAAPEARSGLAALIASARSLFKRKA